MGEGVDCFGAAKINHKGFCIAKVYQLIKYWLGRSYHVMKSTPRVPSIRGLMAVRYKCKSKKGSGIYCY